MVLFVCANFAAAEDGGSAKDWSYQSVGAGLIYSSSPYIGDDARVIPIPVYTYMSETFFFYGIGGGYAIAGDREQGIALYATLGLNLEYYQEDDSWIFEGMGDRDLSVDGGLLLQLRKENWTYELSAKSDILGVSDGLAAEFSLSKSFPEAFGCDKLSAEVSAGLLWRDDNLNDYYFGVEDKYQEDFRPAYSAGGGFNSNIGVTLMYDLNEKWSLYSTVGTEFLSSEISDSPLVDEDINYSAMIGFSYKLD